MATMAETFRTYTTLRDSYLCFDQGTVWGSNSSPGKFQLLTKARSPARSPDPDSGGVRGRPAASPVAWMAADSSSGLRAPRARAAAYPKSYRRLS